MKSLRTTFMALAVLVPSLLTLRPVAGQSVSGQISGHVEDPSGASIVTCTVQLTNELTKQHREVTTDSTGAFVFPGLLSGNYSLRITQGGFRPYEQRPIEVTADERVSLPPIRLALGDASSSITVQAESARLQTDSSERAGLISTTQLTDTPLRGRDYIGTLKILPGIVDLSTRDTPGGNTPQVNGGTTGQVAITLDGIMSQNTGATGGTHYQPTLDAIAEMRVLLTNYQAEYGARSGGVVNVIIKNGTSQFHGSAYYYKRNEALNANNFFNNSNRVNVGADGKARRPVYRYSNLGYTIGGPLIIPGTGFNKSRNKLFFFWSHDILHNKSPTSLQQVTFPTALERQGNFSQSVYGNNGQPVIVRDPTTQAPFPGNIIPTSQVNAAGQTILKLFPLPNAVDATGNRLYNALYQFVQDNPRSNKILRVDYNLGSKTTVYARLLNSYQDSNGYGVATAVATNWPQMQADNSTRAAGAVGTVIHIFRPNLINELTWGINYSLEEISATAAELQKYTLTGAGLGATVPQLYPQANPLNLLPTTSFSAGSGGGIINNAAAISFEARFPYFGTDSIQNLVESVSWVEGKHNTKFGVYYEHTGRNSPHSNAIPIGTLNFGSSNLNPLDSGWGYSNAILGTVQQYSQSNRRTIRQSRYWGFEWYAQDNWRVSRRLTIDIGARFQLTPSPYSDGVNMAVFSISQYSRSANPPLIQPSCLTSARPCSAATGSNPPRGLNPVTGALVPAVLVGAFAPNAGTPFQAMRIYPQKFANTPPIGLGPRLGFAYDVFGDGKMAVRGGFGVFYDRQGQVGGSTASDSCCQFITDPPVTVTPQVFYTTLSDLTAAPAYLTPQAVDGGQQDYKMPATYNWSLGVQRNVGFGTVLDVAYVGNTTRHQNVLLGINESPYGTTRLASGQLNPAAVDPSTGQPYQANFLRPYSGYAGINYSQFSGNTNYHSMQTTVNRRFGRRLQFGGSWTWSKVMSYQASPYVDNRFTYSPDSNDRRHNVTMTWSYRIPNGSRLWKNAATQQLLDGWELTGLAAFLSGGPATVSYSVTGAPAGYTVTGSPSGLVTRIQIVGNPMRPDSERTDKRVSALNPNAFALPAASAFGVGNSSRTFFYGPGLENFDLTLVKNFKLGKESRVLQFRAEMYNALNHVNFNNPSSSAVFNYTTGAQTSTNFGFFSSARDARYMVLAARLHF